MGSGEIAQCVQDLVTGVESADMMPDNPSFVVRCQFCESHAYACTASQLALCRVYRQTQRSNKMLQSQWPRTTLNAFVFLTTSGATIAYATRPVAQVVTAMPLAGFATVFDSWRCFVDPLVLLMIWLLFYMTCFFLLKFLMYTITIYKVLLVGHTVAIVLLVLNSIFGPQVAVMMNGIRLVMLWHFCGEGPYSERSYLIMENHVTGGTISQVP